MTSIDHPPKNDETPGVSARLMKLIERTYVRTGGIRAPGSPEYYAEEMFKIISALRQSKQIAVWPRSDEDSTFSEDREVVLAFYDPAGVIRVAPESVPLPKYPSTLIEGLELYISGGEWGKVKEIIASDPELKGKEVAAQIMENIRRAGSFRDFTFIVGMLNSGLSKSLLANAVYALESRIQAYVDEQAAIWTTLDEARRLHADADNFFKHMQGNVISSLGVYDALDAGAYTLAIKLYGTASSVRDVQRIEKEFSTYPFSFDDVYQQKLKNLSSDVGAKLLFAKQIRAATTTAELEELRTSIETFAFSEERVAEPYRNELIEKINKKRPKQ